MFPLNSPSSHSWFTGQEEELGQSGSNRRFRSGRFVTFGEEGDGVSLVEAQVFWAGGDVGVKGQEAGLVLWRSTALLLKQ